jgi:Cu-Zn family superoxide dismutase
MNEGKQAAGFAAGGHYDPAHTKKHLGPLSAAGHRGDLPVLVVDNQGNATQPVTAPHLTVAQIRGRSVMIHAGATIIQTPRYHSAAEVPASRAA